MIIHPERMDSGHWHREPNGHSVVSYMSDFFYKLLLKFPPLLLQTLSTHSQFLEGQLLLESVMFQSICSASASVSVCPSPLKASAECAKRAPAIISCVHLLISVFTGKWWPLKLNYFHLVFAGDTLKIGDIAYKLKKPQNPELVPVKHSMWFCLFFCTNCNYYVWNKKKKLQLT